MSRLFWGSIEELCEEPQLTEADIRFVEGITSLKRRREITAWRTLLRRSLDEGALVEIAYRENGAPYLVDSTIYISVSHCSSMVALLISDEPCGVDIESCSRDFERVASRFSTAAEVAYFEVVGIDRALALPLIWSAKEALYKVAGVEGVDFIRDVEIVSVEESLICGRIGESRYLLNYLIVDECCILYTQGRSSL